MTIECSCNNFYEDADQHKYFCGKTLEQQNEALVIENRILLTELKSVKAQLGTALVMVELYKAELEDLKKETENTHILCKR
jgi:hypothetical protein